MTARARAGLLILVGVAVAAAFLATRSPGGPPPAGLSQSRHAQHSAANLRRVDVPVDSTERLWRAWVLSHGFGITVGPRAHATGLRHRIEKAVAASGADLVRLEVWGANTRYTPVELVVATAHPAFYLRHRLGAVLAPFDHGYLYVQVANARGAKILEWALRTRTGSFYVKPALDRCSPITHGEFIKPPACPAK